MQPFQPGQAGTSGSFQQWGQQHQRDMMGYYWMQQKEQERKNREKLLHPKCDNCKRVFGYNDKKYSVKMKTGFEMTLCVTCYLKIK